MSLLGKWQKLFSAPVSQCYAAVSAGHGWGKPHQHSLLQSVCSHHKTVVAKTSESLKRCWLKGTCVGGTLAKHRP